MESSECQCVLKNLLWLSVGKGFVHHTHYRSPIHSEWISNIQTYVPPTSYQSMEWVFHFSYRCYLLHHYIVPRFLPKAKRSVNWSDSHFKELETLHWAVRYFMSNGRHLKYRNILPIFRPLPEVLSFRNGILKSPCTLHDPSFLGLYWQII